MSLDNLSATTADLDHRRAAAPDALMGRMGKKGISGLYFIDIDLGLGSM